MLPTPSTTHIDPTRIYEPAEDSFLLLDTLSSSPETEFLKARFPPSQAPIPTILEVGTGSGVVLAFIAAHARTLLGRQDILTLGVDINPSACQATAETIRKACQNRTDDAPPLGLSDVLCADLTTALRPCSIDILIFNPPYVPTEDLPCPPLPPPLPPSTIIPLAENARTKGEAEFRTSSYLLSLSYAGGKDGMQVTNKLLAQLPEILCPRRGVAYVLLCQQNRPEEVVRRIREGEWDGLGEGRWAVEIVGRSGKVGGWERLVVLRIWRE